MSATNLIDSAWQHVWAWIINSYVKIKDSESTKRVFWGIIQWRVKECFYFINNLVKWVFLLMSVNNGEHTEWGSLWYYWLSVFPPSQCPAVYRAQSGNLKGHTKTEEILT